MSLTVALHMLAVLMLAVLLVTLVRLQRIGKADHGKVAQVHHGYGVVLALIPVLPIQIVALLIGLDDTYQHLRQIKEPTYRSPLHKLAHKVGVI